MHGNLCPNILSLETKFCDKDKYLTGLRFIVQGNGAKEVPPVSVPKHFLFKFNKSTGPFFTLLQLLKVFVVLGDTLFLDCFNVRISLPHESDHSSTYRNIVGRIDIYRDVYIHGHEQNISHFQLISIFRTLLFSLFY